MYLASAELRPPSRPLLGRLPTVAEHQEKVQAVNAKAAGMSTAATNFDQIPASPKRRIPSRCKHHPPVVVATCLVNEAPVRETAGPCCILRCCTAGLHDIPLLCFMLAKMNQRTEGDVGCLEEPRPATPRPAALACLCTPPEVEAYCTTREPSSQVTRARPWRSIAQPGPPSSGMALPLPMPQQMPRPRFAAMCMTVPDPVRWRSRCRSAHPAPVTPWVVPGVAQ